MNEKMKELERESHLAELRTKNMLKLKQEGKWEDYLKEVKRRRAKRRGDKHSVKFL